ncbi:MAG: FAD-binding oxidoreductase [Saprospiraceae bacterium]|jgi:ferredoxin-NADP reductase|nr:FAD-binding oxidoreductase [Saprospiraceae bacterium]
MTHWYTAEVTEILPLTEHTRQFNLCIPELENFEFLPGQFITFDLPVGEKRRDRWRSYSIASAPAGNNQFSLCIVRNPHGKGSNYLFEEVREGSKLTCKGPDGVFTMPPLTGRQLIFVCTGTGIAPFRSMLQTIDQKTLAFDSIHLIFGTRYSAQVLYRDEWEVFAGKYSQFRWDVALSRESCQPFHSGYVHELYTSLYSNPVSERHFYLCGWTPMIDEGVRRLKEIGYSEAQIHFELYG